jgi:hypothetical protein
MVSWSFLIVVLRESGASGDHRAMDVTAGRNPFIAPLRL